MFAILFFGTGHASTTTLTFDSVPNGFTGYCEPSGSTLGGNGYPGTYLEQGYSVSGCPAYYGTPGSIHLDDSGTALTNSVTVKTSSKFDAISVDVSVGPQTSSSFRGPDSTGAYVAIPYQNLLFQGVVNGSVVSSLFVSTQTSPTYGWSTIALGSSFLSIDALKITQVFPSAAEYAANPYAYCDAPCGHTNIDNLTLVSAVPLPATFPLLMAALLVLRRRKVR